MIFKRITVSEISMALNIWISNWARKNSKSSFLVEWLALCGGNFPCLFMPKNHVLRCFKKNVLKKLFEYIYRLEIILCFIINNSFKHYLEGKIRNKCLKIIFEFWLYWSVGVENQALELLKKNLCQFPAFSNLTYLFFALFDCIKKT